MYSVVIPTLNEEGNIGELVAQLKTDNNCQEVVVCDGGSTDGTVTEATSAGALVIFSSGQSVSDAIDFGINNANTDSVVVMDADFSHPPGVVSELGRLLKFHEMVYGWRVMSGDSLFNRFISLLGKIFSFYLAPSVSDRMTGLFGLRVSYVVSKNIIIKRGPKPFLEYFVKGFPTSIEGIPYIFEKRKFGKTKLGRRKILLTGIRQLINLYLFKYKQFIKYSIVGGSGVLVYLMWVILSEEILGLGYGIGILIGSFHAFFHNYVFHKLWTFAVDQNIPLRSLPNTLWNLGHDNEDGDFEWWEWYSGLPHKRFKRVLGKHIRALAGDANSLLSLGCGSSPIINMFDGERVGIDISPRKVEFLSRHTDARVVVGDITCLSPDILGDRKFDVVLCNEVVEHLYPKGFESALQSVKRYLEPGGKVVISTPDTSSKIGKLVEVVLHGEFHTNMMTAKQLISKVEGAGFIYKGSRAFLWDKIHLFTAGV